MSKRKVSKACLSAYHNEVTGSRNLLEVSFVDGRTYHILVDCGYFQEIEYRHLNYMDDLDPTKIDAILVTHNHIDHTGLLPKMVKNGYRNPIYMTQITKQILPKFLKDSADQQEDNAKYLRDKYPVEAWRFHPLYNEDDVEKTMRLCRGLNYEETYEILPGIKVTYFVNGHLLGAGFILVQCEDHLMKPINFFFTGDYKLTNPFFTVPDIPAWVRRLELIMVHESTYGNTNSKDIKVCFTQNLLEAFSKNLFILIGAFAQGRMQEVLYDLRKLQDKNLIPEQYEIWVDGPLGIDTNYKYQKILNWFNPETSDFLPKNLQIVDPKQRNNILNSTRPRIVVTTSGMLSNGPARQYVPMFLEHNRAMIHLTGYAAEETLARTLLDAKRSEMITIGGNVYHKRAVVKSTREKTSHVTLDGMLDFINQFDDIEFLAINHGEESVQNYLACSVKENCPDVEMVDVLNRQHVYYIYQMATAQDRYSNLVIKKAPSKLEMDFPSERAQQIMNKKEKQKYKKEKRREEKRDRKKAKRKKKGKKRR